MCELVPGCQFQARINRELSVTKVIRDAKKKLATNNDGGKEHQNFPLQKKITGQECRTHKRGSRLKCIQYMWENYWGERDKLWKC